ncbi:MAG: hypothetical protein R2747_10775 [Pyrinomonadaceae bacterium]
MNNGSNKIERIIHLMQTDNSVDAPQDAILWSKNIFRSRAAEESSKSSIIKKVLAVLKIDLAPNRTAFGERSASTAQGRQMLFEAGENGLDLRITETEKGLTVQGQILGEGFSGAIVKLGDLETKANDLSEFGFSGVSKGEYDLTLISDEREIVIEELELN